MSSYLHCAILIKSYILSDIWDLFFIFCIVCSTTGANPFIHFGQFKLPQTSNLVSRHISFGNPLQDCFTAYTKMFLHFF